MKKLLLFVSLLINALGLSQPMTVSSTGYTVPQLVNNVLINSPCVSATNITWRTGTNYGSANGIGFFQNTNPGFPMQSGVILSTGNAMNASGPNSTILNDGSTTWTGDVTLEATLAAAGISMVSTNATILEFDFTPISPNFSFDFIFASEEYGNFQCQYSDAFAFLLTNMNTGTTTNLAVVPNTTTPISVVNIRDFLYNSSCPSANPQYFGTFNGGSAAANSATNFNGQTKVLTAASVLTPGVPYHIKLVIADRLDPQSDSAIFISSESFNIGQDVLGLDLTSSSNAALCFGATHTLNTGLNAADYTFAWDRNGVALSSETGPSLTITQAGTYSVTYTSNANFCQPITDTIIVEYYPEITTQDPTTIYKCDTGAANYNFNLDLNTPIVKQGLDSSTVVTYHASQSNADNNLNPLPLVYNSPSGQTVFVRIQNPNNGCFIVKSFQLEVTPGPIANQPLDLIKCARGYTLNNARFNLSPQTPIVLNGQSPTINMVSYYTSLNDANNNINEIPNPSVVILSSTTVYVRVQNVSDPNCFSITSFNITVIPAPIVDDLENIIVCTEYILPELTNGNYFTETNGNGTPMFAGDVITETQTVFIFNQPGGPDTCGSNSSFTVTVVNPSTFSPDDVTSCGNYTIPSTTYGNYFTAAGGNGTLLEAGTVITSSQTVYLYFVTTVEPICILDADVQITIVPTLEVGNRADVFECSTYTLPALTLGNYYTGIGGTGNQLLPGTSITSSQTIYVYATTAGTSSCSDEDSFEVYIGLTQPENISQCNGYTLPQLPIGNYYTGPMGTGQQIPDGTVINVSSTVYIYAPTTSGGPNCTDNLFFTLSISQPLIDILSDVSACESYTLPSLTNGEYYTETDGTGTQLYPGDVIISTQTIYIFKRLNNNCFNQSSFIVTINPLPAISSRSDIDICDQYVLTALQVGDYFTGPDGTGTMLTAGTVITTSQRIYIYAVSGTTPACIAQNSFQINIFTTSADVMANVTACDSFTLPTLSANNKYYTQSGGPIGIGTEILPGTVITNNQTIYIFKESLIRTSFSCIDETSFTVTINNTPVIPAIVDVFYCESYTLRPLIIGNYYTGTGGTGTLLQAGDSITNTQTLYVFASSNTSPDCTSEISFNITIFNVDALPNVTTCENFTLPNLTVGQYFTGPNGTGLPLSAGSTISTSQTVYIFAISPYLPRCSDESSFTVTIIDTPIANTVLAAQRTACDEDGTNDGVTSFNLSNLTATILGTQTGSEFTLAYYETMSDALNQSNAITTTLLSTVYVRVNNNLTSSCYDIKSISLIINTLPEPTPTNGIICFDSETQTLLSAYEIQSGLSSATHTFIWTNEEGSTVGTESNYTAILPGTYTLVAIKTATGCSSEPISVTVSPSEPAVVTYTVEEDFSDSQSITVTATGQGNNFEYQLDDGQFQDSPVFNNVSSGLHTITVRDRNGCGSTTIQAVVINYPKYFTPNGDGYHDTWNITNLSNQPSALITIFDRYGKAIKQIRPNGNGWDGTYNGHMMPSDDYWFSVSYTDENQVNQEFRSHFAMKR